MPARAKWMVIQRLYIIRRKQLREALRARAQPFVVGLTICPQHPNVCTPSFLGTPTWLNMVWKDFFLVPSSSKTFWQEVCGLGEDGRREGRMEGGTD